MKKSYNKKYLFCYIVTILLPINVTYCVMANTVSGNSEELEKIEQVDNSLEMLLEENNEILLFDENALSLGGAHSAVIAKDGSLYTWGANEAGQLGNGTNTNSNIPIKIMDNIASVSFWGTSSAAITRDGNLYTWGYNLCGQLGNGTVTDSYTPIKIMTNVVSISFGGYSSAAITRDGNLYTWGENYYGQLGNGTNINSSVPVKIMENVISVSLSTQHSMAIAKDGSLYTWGRNASGELGNGTNTNSNIPIKIMENVISVSIGECSSAAITRNGDLYMWGNNYYGQLGNGTNTNSNVPVKVMDNIKMVSLGDYSSAAITMDGNLYVWGEWFGNIPIKIIDNVVSVSVGESHNTAITRNGDLYMWGWNYYGQLGNGTNTDSNVVPVKVMENVIMAEGGYFHSAAITKEGSLYMWGWNGCGALGDGTNTDSAIPLKIMDNIYVFDNNVTNIQDFVYRLYNVALSRTADEDGLADWTNRLDTQTESAAEVAWGFFFSDEFKNKNYTDEQYVELLYKTMFGRTSDASGKADWLKCLENGVSREYVYRGFAESEEFSNLCSSYGVNRGTVTLGQYRDRNMQATGFIARLYTKMLGRKFDEDGLEYWCRAYLTKEKTIENIASDGFLHSQELNNLNLNNKEFVTRMYETFLNREPEEAGLNDWVGRLEHGEETRDSLVYGFTNSREFANLKAEYNLP